MAGPGLHIVERSGAFGHQRLQVVPVRRQFGLVLLAHADVAEDIDRTARLAILQQGRDGVFDGQGRPIPPPVAVVGNVPGLAIAHGCRDRAFVRWKRPAVGMVMVGQRVQVGADPLALGPAQHVACRVVDEDDRSLGIDPDHPLAGRSQDQFDFLSCRLGLLVAQGQRGIQLIQPGPVRFALLPTGIGQAGKNQRADRKQQNQAQDDRRITLPFRQNFLVGQPNEQEQLMRRDPVETINAADPVDTGGGAIAGIQLVGIEQCAQLRRRRPLAAVGPVGIGLAVAGDQRVSRP